MRRKHGHSNRIRNGQLRRDFKRLLEIIADYKEPKYDEVEEIAGRNAFYYDDEGAVVEKESRK